MNKETTPELLKISQLAKEADTNVSTIKFYIKEGLLQAAEKTSPNMAYYHKDCIARVRLIKSLQKEHYYPLSVIKHMLSVSETNLNELKLMDVIHKADSSAVERLYTLKEVMELTRFSKNKVAAVVREGLISPEVSGKRLMYSDADLQVCLLLRRRADAGIPFEQSVESFRIYQKSLDSAVGDDVDSLVRDALMVCSPSTEDAVRMISVSDETLDRFIKIKRLELNRKTGSERLEELDGFSQSLSLVLHELSDILENQQIAKRADECRRALKEELEGNNPVAVSLRFYYFVIRSMKGNLADSLVQCSSAYRYFLDLNPARVQDRVDSVILYFLKYQWLYLAPSLLQCTEEAEKTYRTFSQFTATLPMDSSGSFGKKLLEIKIDKFRKKV